VVGLFFEQAGFVVRERFRVLVQQLLSIFGPANTDIPHLESEIFGHAGTGKTVSVLLIYVRNRKSPHYTVCCLSTGARE
jgi:hypothetical protein